jgi:hypothetical protein
MSHDPNRPSIDHAILSPSGRCSKRAREAAIKRDHDRLFPPGYWDEPKQTQAEIDIAEAVSLRRHAATLRDLAARGMKRRAFTMEADRLESVANRLMARG